MIAGGILIGGNRPWNLIVGTTPIRDIFYNGSIFTHWNQISARTWGEIGVWTWNQDLYAHEENLIDPYDSNHYIGNFVFGLSYL